VDSFKKAQSKEICVGGYKCPCCSPFAGAGSKAKNRKKAKQTLYQAARSRIKAEIAKEDI